MSADAEKSAEVSTPTSSADNVPSVEADYAWGVVGANWFLITVGYAIQSNWLMTGTFTTLLGGLMAIIIAAAIPVSIIYLCVPNKRLFRWRRAMTIAGWFALFLMLYPQISDLLKGT